MSDSSVTAKSSPRFWVPVVEGLVALVLGIYIVLAPADAPAIVRGIIAAALLVLSVVRIGEGFRFWNRPVSPWATLGGGVGVTAATLTLLSNWAPEIPAAAARQTLAIGLTAFGIIGLVSLIFTVRSTGFKFAALIIDVLAVVIGVFLFLAEEQNVERTRVLGGVAIAGGAVLLIYGYILWRKTRQPTPPLHAEPGPLPEPETGPRA
ncbi:MAG: hypothetical protein KC442_04285 [Thermomicrobiales bacterium]|nr:hypothetical protein [Thermomicrobiales bacterium]